MALAKTKVDLIGSEAGGTITWVTLAAAGTTSFALRDVSDKMGISFIFRVKYGVAAPTTRPKLELFTAPVNSANVQDTEPYATVELPTTTNGEKQVTIPLRFTEDVKYIAGTITMGATNGADVYCGAVEATI